MLYIVTELVLFSFNLMSYFLIIPLWSDAGGSVQLITISVEEISSAERCSGGEIGAVYQNQIMNKMLDTIKFKNRPASLVSK